jgi:cytochrome P450
VLTRLIQGDEGGQLTQAELVQNCIFILNAGHETTTNLIGNALVCLATRPDAQASLRHADEEGMALAVEEFLRFESSNQLGNRRAQKATTIAGERFEVGQLVTLCIGAANRDPAVFAAPDELRLDRFAPHDNRAHHLAFGFGIHQCAGMSVARLEAQVALSGFLKRFSHFELARRPERARRVRFRGFSRAWLSAKTT